MCLLSSTWELLGNADTLWGGSGIFVVTSPPGDSNAGSGLRTSGSGGGSCLGLQTQGGERSRGGVQRGRGERKRHLVLNSPGRRGSKGKTEGSGGREEGQWAGRGLQRKKRVLARTGEREGCCSGEGAVLWKRLGCLSSRSHPAPSRHLLRLQQRVVFL